jgi:DNA-binding transcriptional MerR regulator
MNDLNMQTYSIGQACKIVELPQSVLRYWETVFEALKPEKTPGGTRRYSEKDIEIILTIKDLLYNRRLTIEGARSWFKDKKQIVGGKKEIKLQEYVIDEIQSILKILNTP